MIDEASFKWQRARIGRVAYRTHSALSAISAFSSYTSSCRLRNYSLYTCRCMKSFSSHLTNPFTVVVAAHRKKYEQNFPLLFLLMNISAAIMPLCARNLTKKKKWILIEVTMSVDEDGTSRGSGKLREWIKCVKKTLFHCRRSFVVVSGWIRCKQCFHLHMQHAMHLSTRVPTEVIN